MLGNLLVLIALLASLSAHAAAPRGDARTDHVADQECVACHTSQATLWASSKHDLAMQVATPTTVLGDFNDASFSGVDQHARFFRRGADFVVRTKGPDGAEADFPVTHAFGVYPLQQYLLPLPGGRLQALSIAWDTRRNRWFSLYPEGGIAPGSSLHWSGRYQNWNLMCGECHTTAFDKRYDDERDSYRTTWAAASARRLAARSSTAPAPAARPSPTPNQAMSDTHGLVDQCAACHSRRTRLQEITTPGRPFLDNFIPDNLRGDLYHADGQQLEEVFEYGSFRQSRMYQAGVGCSDCHEPHSGKTRATGNALCLSCHNPSPDTPRFPGLKAKDYDSPQHHFHTAGTPGSECVACHMPSRNYMIVHDRRDHAIRIPRPDLTRRIGTPNACQSCHAERPAEWAEAAIDRHHGARTRPEHYGEVFAAGRAGKPGADARLAALIDDAQQPAIVRATAIELLAAIGTRPPSAAALADGDPAVRATAAAAWSATPAEERLARLPPLLGDPIRAVRITAARGLADLADEQLPAQTRQLRNRALAEYIDAQRAMGDMPSAQLNLASLFAMRGDSARAARHYRLAIAQDPQMNMARLNYAQLLAAGQRHDEAAKLLREGLPKSVNPGELHFALGLLAGQRQQWDEAARELQAAAALLPDDQRIRRNLGIVLRHLRDSLAR
jgi:predicted CXXCH cytochrome family protein